MKYLLILAVVAGGLYYFLIRPEPIKDAELKRAVDHVVYHAKKHRVEKTVAVPTEKPYKPSDWLAVFLSSMYTAQHAPEPAIQVMTLSWSLSEHEKKLKDFVAGGFQLTLAPDDEHYELILRGYKNQDPTNILFERRILFPEIESKIPHNYTRRTWFTRLFRRYFPEQPPNDAKYLVKSGRIDYSVATKTSGGIIDFTIEGNSRHYFDHWGKQQATLYKSMIDTVGIVDLQNSLLLVDNTDEYEIDFTKNTGSKHTHEQLRKPAYSEATLIEEGYTQTGVDTVAERECAVWEKENYSLCVWKQIALLDTQVIFGKYIRLRATKVIEDEIIPPYKFQVPENVEIK